MTLLSRLCALAITGFAMNAIGNDAPDTPKGDLHYIVVDRSSSIEGRRLVDPIIKAVSRYVDVLPVSSEVRILFFNEEVSGKNKWELTEARIKDDVKRHFDKNFYPNGYTRLYDTVEEVISEVTLVREKYKTVKIMILSDGEDNRSVKNHDWSRLEVDAGLLKKDNADSFIYWYTLGFKPREVPKSGMIEVKEIPKPEACFEIESEADRNIDFIRLAAAVYHDWDNPEQAFGRRVIEELKASGWKLAAPLKEENGFRAAVYTSKDGQPVLVFQGLDNLCAWEDIIQVVRYKLPFINAQQFTFAEEFAQASIRAYGDNLIFVGHSMGGALAQYVAIKTNKRALTVNPMAVTFDSVIDQLKSGGMTSEGRIVNYVHRNDILGNARDGVTIRSDDEHVTFSNDGAEFRFYGTGALVGEVVFVGDQEALCKNVLSKVLAGPVVCKTADVVYSLRDHGIEAVLQELTSP